MDLRVGKIYLFSIMKNIFLIVGILLLLVSCKDTIPLIVLAEEDTSLWQLAEKLNDETLTPLQVTSVENELAALTPTRKEQLYSILRRKSITNCETAGLDMSLEKQLLPKTELLCKEMNKQSVKKYNVSFWDLSPEQRQIITDLVDTENFFNWDRSFSKTAKTNSCTIESFPYISTYKSTNHFYGAYQITDVANSSSDWICDNKIWYDHTGVDRWYCTSIGLKNALISAYGGNIGTQVSNGKRRFIVGISIWAYGYYSGDLLSYLKLSRHY